MARGTGCAGNDQATARGAETLTAPERAAMAERANAQLDFEVEFGDFLRAHSDGAYTAFSALVRAYPFDDDEGAYTMTGAEVRAAVNKAVHTAAPRARRRQLDELAYSLLCGYDDELLDASDEAVVSVRVVDGEVIGWVRDSA